MAVCHLSIHPPNGPQSDKAGSSGCPCEHGPPLLLRLHVVDTPRDFTGLLKFNALPLTDTLWTHPIKSSECICPGRSRTGSADDSPPISNGCLLKFNVLKSRRIDIRHFCKKNNVDLSRITLKFNVQRTKDTAKDLRVEWVRSLFTLQFNHRLVAYIFGLKIKIQIIAWFTLSGRVESRTKWMKYTNWSPIKLLFYNRKCNSFFFARASFSFHFLEQTVCFRINQPKIIVSDKSLLRLAARSPFFFSRREFIKIVLLFISTYEEFSISFLLINSPIIATLHEN